MRNSRTWFEFLDVQILAVWYCEVKEPDGLCAIKKEIGKCRMSSKPNIRSLAGQCINNVEHGVFYSEALRIAWGGMENGP